MKFVKGPPESSPTYCLVDWQIIAAAHSNEVWGIIIDNVQAEIDARTNRILELKDDVKNRYAHIEHSPNTDRLEKAMD